MNPQVKRAGFSGGNINLEGREGVGDGDAVPGHGGARAACLCDNPVVDNIGLDDLQVGKADDGVAAEV